MGLKTAPIVPPGASVCAEVLHPGLRRVPVKAEDFGKAGAGIRDAKGAGRKAMTMYRLWKDIAGDMLWDQFSFDEVIVSITKIKRMKRVKTGLAGKPDQTVPPLVAAMIAGATGKP